MKSNLNRIFAITAFALITVCAFANPVSAQNVAFKGSFTLSEDARWNNVNLPAGDYTFQLKSAVMPAQITLQGPNGNAFILTAASDPKADGDVSKMTIERHGATRIVKDLYLANLGLHLCYLTPSLPKNELAMGPVSTEQVLVAMTK